MSMIVSYLWEVSSQQLPVCFPQADLNLKKGTFTLKVKVMSCLKII